jgi:hypothetical protein
MSSIVRDALDLNHHLFLWRHENHQLIIASAWFILWLAYHSVKSGQMSSMLTDTVQAEILQILNHICDDQTQFYPDDLRETILELRE